MGGMILPDADWRHREGLAHLVEVLGDVRFVGGSVRDTLLDLPVSDLDVATPLPPQRVLELLKGAGIRAVPTGIDHGTITAVLASGPVEVTTLRRDVSTDGRRATVAFTDDWREDAARRDFTINALYADPASGEIFDYFGGLADLEVRHVRFIGDAFQRIAEDHLRILRFFRFLARFGDVADPAGLEACTARSRDLMALSRERIADELLKLLVAKDAVRVVALMIERGIFLPVLPEITSADRFANLAAREDAAGVAPDAIRRLASLIPTDATLAELIAARLKLSKAQRKRLASAVVPPESNFVSMAWRAGVEAARDRLLIFGSPLSEVAVLEAWQPPRFPLSGGAIVARGIKAGPKVAQLMKQVEEAWIAEGFPDEARVSALADEAVAQALRSTSSA
ncbi:CCA tRNA nucleotidyltransferase [Sphingomonas kyeonggiensis]|uniref:Poly(A) polymerase n=1 Tax=Sphingomonas kyeonggiensis TaxID=1268553 RepID=A0A7W6NX07_9SPHN|nr:CCA tRNA nucleotidyltransferase [Sphingomonas kyeonggiensis]MBB4098181.1 poly(A) polymerase [Sphingomonas kyeonggiensis]